MLLPDPSEVRMISIQLRNLNTSTHSLEITVMNAFAFVSILTFSKVTDAFYSCLSSHMNTRSIRNVNAPTTKVQPAGGSEVHNVRHRMVMTQ